MAKHSDSFQTIEKNKIGGLASELNSLADLFYNNKYKLVLLKTGRVGVCAEILTKANSRSVLHRTEPIVIVLSLTNWENIPPFVFPDRIGFPYNHFPHVYYEGENYPAGLCLTRENLQDWYSEHTLRDYVARLNEWMQDAAKTNLIKIKEKDEFEPQRYLSRTIEATFYRLFFDDTVLERQEAPSCQFFNINVQEDGIGYGSDVIKDLNGNGIGVRLFKGNKDIDEEWIVEYPKSLGDLFQFIERKKYPFNAQDLIAKLDISKKYVYFMLALLRPVKLIEKESKINYLCFRAKASDILTNKLDAHVDEVLIKDYPNYTTARNLSMTPKTIYDKRVVILGCGAVGSKIALHLFRSGIDKLTLVDYDNFEPHNLCRHALLCTPFDKGRNKASLLKETFNKMFFGTLDNIEAENKEAIAFLRNANLSKYELIIDATASAAVMHGIDTIRFPETTKLVRTCLSEGGDIGITYVTTGSQRYMTDYYAEILRQAITDDDIANWLKQEKKNTLEDIRIGEGCHSATMRVSDDTISSHTALMSSAIRHLFEPKAEDGFMLTIANDIFHGSMVTFWYKAPNYHEFTCENDSSWHVRIPSTLLNNIRIQAKAHGKKETGGYLFGQIDLKRHLVYIVDHFVPTDSKHAATQVGLSKKGFLEYDKLVEKRTANQLYYLGDWHSHPTSTLKMSEQDIHTCIKSVLPAMKEGIGLCVITKTIETKFFLIYNNFQIQQQ